MIKKTTVAVALLLLLSNAIEAQTIGVQTVDTINYTGTRWRDTSFGLLNLQSSQIPSGYLIDYSMAGFNDSLFNSNTGTKLDTITESGFFLALQNLFIQSKVNSAATLGSTDSLYMTAYRYRRDSGNIPLLFLYQQYQKIRKTALSQGLFTLTPDSIRLKDVAGRTTSPYDTKSFFAFTPFQTVISQFTSIQFGLPASLWLMPGITSVQIDFGDGAGFRTLLKGNTVSINYTAAGTYYLTANITVSGTTFTARSSIQFSTPPSYMHPDSTFTVTVAPLYASITDYLNSPPGFAGNHTVINNGLNGGAASCTDGSIFDQVNCDINPGAVVTLVKGCDNVFDKPIIIVTGFDPSNSYTYKKLADYMNLYYGGYVGSNYAAPTFYSDMLQNGYDFVFVTFTKNSDLIENNAQVLEQVITIINSIKTGTNKSTIVGISMGGLIVRWALKDMEDHGIDHKVANYFSYDSPHQGANVPLGIQYFFNELLNDMPFLKSFGQISDNYNAFTSKAAQQMLVTYAGYGTNHAPLTSPLSAVRVRFAQGLLNKGYPQNVNRYAISNGRGNNTSGTTNAGNGAQFGNFGPGSLIFSGTLSILGLESFATNVSAVPKNSVANICHYAYGGWKIGRIFGIPVPYFVFRTRDIEYTGINPYDDAPGGFENTQSAFVDGLTTSVIPLVVSALATNLGHYGHNFVPLASALDLQNQSYGSANYFQSSNMYYAIDNNIQNPGLYTGNTLSTPSLSPFKAVLTYTSDCGVANEACVNYSDDNLLGEFGINPVQYNNWNKYHEGAIANQTAFFIERKILNTNTVTPCSAPGTDICSNSLTITGPNPLCTSTGTYSLVSSSSIRGITVQWSFPDGDLGPLSGQGTPAITVMQQRKGPEIVTALLTNACGQTSTRTLPISVGGPAVGINATPGSCNGHTQTWTLSANPSSYGSNWLWTVGYVGTGSSIYIYSPTSPTTFVDVVGGGAVNLAYKDLCNAPGTDGVTVYSNCHGFTVTPNPASTTVTIASFSAAAKTGNGQSLRGTLRPVTIQPVSLIKQVKILDADGRVRKLYSYSNAVTQVQIDIRAFLPGTYFVEIYDGKNIDFEKLIIGR